MLCFLMSALRGESWKYDINVWAEDWLVGIIIDQYLAYDMHIECQKRSNPTTNSKYKVA